MPTLNKIRLATEVALVLACSFLYAWGSRLSGQRAELDTRRQTLEQQVATLQQSKQETEQDARTVVRTVTRPDGTKSVTTTREHLTVHETEHDTSQVQTQRSESEVSHAAVPVGPDLARYSLDLDWSPAVPSLTPYLPTGAHVGARLGNLPLWLSAGAERSANGRGFIPVLGVRYEW